MRSSNAKLNIISIIPARMGSSRFPGKPMADILGMPMIGHVYKRVKMSRALSEVYVATCDQEIYDYIESIGGKAIMTSNCHERCSDRCAEAMLKIEQESNQKCDIMVMVQGDEPLTHPGMIDEAVAPMVVDKSILITNLMADLDSVASFENPNEVKVVTDKFNNALYFSREPIPSRKKGVLDVPMKKQVCVIPFTRDFLLQYNQMKSTPLEIIESVDMMRILENGLSVKMINTKYTTKAVDTKEDLEQVKEMMIKDKLYKEYKCL
ncbi:3-deoxy-manno-octulosonate cytidylyltransferase [Campylobacter hyointestinalis]|uniref:3-deoxy-manno-octulosonate cytidylyltransferase n=1 Tax=Campylobacter hyointestinalis TaxID=198 RepID=UPI00072519F0|nr:3-deoxy-manno-octulosonate cytidylyltransferase [Campylobacter hyointestinalis]ANE31759.1 3-deoxy-D-manno-octulosonate cytidylyltransferase [Campylobacter hyointestinalis subsp. hyointestinalis LMG 9260]MDY2998785.1 3-deoxy-manno-octulosonate cytidylyltransferase [Campylobacter hyointestinalis]QKF54924.1 3-deoxy-D-manno-octulosonate cytidylyltransferase [Campylobacter hyointestinalis subsp. hyointestinalis]CUU69382.1 3-deoxy-manno-octulosonate cytidylyltransferase [Campylobacter hyointestina